MELLITFVLITLLSIAVCNLFGAKAKTIATITVVIDIAYIVVVCFTVDLRPLLNAFTVWVKAIVDEVMSKF